MDKNVMINEDVDEEYVLVRSSKNYHTVARVVKVFGVFITFFMLWNAFSQDGGVRVFSLLLIVALFLIFIGLGYVLNGIGQIISYHEASRNNREKELMRYKKSIRRG